MLSIFGFENLEVWQLARTLIKEVYKEISSYPSYERYALCDQLRRASVSVSSNIAEGSARFSAKDQLRFYDMAYSSLVEVRSELLVAFDLGYSTEERIDEISKNIIRVAQMLAALMNSCRTRING